MIIIKGKIELRAKPKKKLSIPVARYDAVGRYQKQTLPARLQISWKRIIAEAEKHSDCGIASSRPTVRPVQK
jgi:hypothetical protein